jgi:succinyl-diaminopimelate desuccinylase
VTEPVRALDLAQALIRCESVTPTEGGALTVIENALSGLGFECHRLKFSAEGTPDVENLYARHGTGRPNFCFAGHTDVVPVGDREAWTADPFGGTVKDGMLRGRGAADMKAAIACFIAATARFLERRGARFSGSISLLITGDEEGPAINGTVKVLDWLKRRGEELDACVVGEPTNPEKLGDMVKIGRRGSLNGALTVVGTQGHTAYPHLADNPIPRLMTMLRSIIETPLDRGNDNFQPSTVEISSIDTGNEATNVIPGRVSAKFNVRFNDIHDSKSVTEWLRRRFDAVGGAYDLDIHVSGESFLTPPGPFSTTVAGAIEKVTGRAPELSTTGGTSDARFIKDFCPVAEFGLTSTTMHKVDEQIPVDDVAALTGIYEEILERFFAGP